MRIFNFKAFIISLAIGLFITYTINTNEEEIFVYPTLENINELVYKDKANHCFKFKAEKIECPTQLEKINNIPIQ